MNTLFIIGGIILTIMLSLFVFMLSIKFDDKHSASKNSLHVKVFKVLTFTNYDVDIPNNICSYFWTYVGCILLLPISFPIVIFGIVFPKYRNGEILLNSLIVFISIYLFILLLGLIWGIYTLINTYSFIQLLTGLFIIVGVLGSLIGFVFLIIWIGKPITSLLINIVPSSNKVTKDLKPKKESMLILKFKNWKDKNCSIINWT